MVKIKDLKILVQFIIFNIETDFELKLKELKRYLLI